MHGGEREMLGGMVYCTLMMRWRVFWKFFGSWGSSKGYLRAESTRRGARAATGRLARLASPVARHLPQSMT